MRILVIEDDADICSICEHIFTWAGHEVAAALDGKPGLELVESFEPDVIALDIMMPGVDGLTVLAELRGSVLTRDIPVVVVSARTLNADRLRAFASEMAGSGQVIPVSALRKGATSAPSASA